MRDLGPDPLSYASASDFHAANNTSSDSSPSHHQSTASHHNPHPHSHSYHDGEDDHHQQQQQQQHQQPQHNNHWTYDDDHSNNNSHYDHTPTNNAAFGSTTGIGGGEMDNGPTVSHHSNTSTHSNMDNDADSLVGFEDGGTTSPFAYGMESSGHGRLGREGSADGGSTLPLPGADVDNDDDDDTADIIDTNKSNSKTSNKSNSNNASKSSKDANNSSSAESTPRRSASASSPRAKSATGSNPPAKMVTSADMSMLDMKTSWDGSATSGGGGGGGGGNKAGMLADPAKIAKEREREERVRQARERLEGERKKKLEELREQQRLAQENRERQLEMRRQKIEDLRKRDTERRAAVEERRRMKEEIERLRKESILQKAEERVARYEAWRAGGRKGNLPGFDGGGTPRHLSVSTSVLYSKRHSDFSSSTTLSPANRPDSTLDRSKARPGRRKDKAVAKDAKGKDKKEEAEDEKDGGTHSTTTTKKGRVSLSFFDRLATPKFHRNQDEQKDTSSAKKESPIVRLSPRKAYSTTNLSTIKKKTSFREKSKGDSSSTSSTPRHMTPRRDHSASSPRVSGVSPAPGGIMSKSMSSAISPRVTPPPTSSSPHPPTPSISVSSHQGGGSSATQAPSSEDGGSATSSSRTGGGGTNQDISKEEYKAKIAEKRRQAREKAEKEAEEERKRQEEERLAEEERMRQEDEEQQRLEEESIRLAAEARKAEGERLERAIEAEEKRKREEAERLEQEKKAKEEADRKAKEEAERMEREKQERAKKEEEERMQRKKKLEMIMKRVKTDPAQDTSQKVDSPVKSTSSSPNRSALASPEVQEMPPFGQEQDNSSGSEDGKQNAVPAPTERNAENSEMTKSMSSDPAPLNPVVRSASSGDILDSAADEDKKEMEKGDSLGSLNTPAKSTNGTGSEPSSTEVKSRFKSPLLQQLVENKGDSPSGTPKFKSPLLQNLLGKTKVGARMGLSASMGDLNLSKGGNAQPQQQESSPLSSLSPAGSSKEISKAGQDEDKDVDESVGSSASSSSGNDQESFKPQSSSPRPQDDDQDHLTNGKSSGSDGDENVYGGRYDDAVVMTKSSPEFSPVGVAMIDSALGSSIEPQQGDALEFSTPSSVMSNGHGAKNMMEDSSIVVQTPEDDVPVPAPIATTFNQFNYQSGQSSSQDETEEEEDDDEERRDDGGNGRFEELIDLPYSSANSSSKAAVSPIIAFEENSLRAADVGESMS